MQLRKQSYPDCDGMYLVVFCLDDRLPENLNAAGVFNGGVDDVWTCFCG